MLHPLTPPSRSCEAYTAWTAQTTTSLNAVLLRDDSLCPKESMRKVTVIAGSVAFGLVALIIIIILVLIKLGVLRQSSFLLLARDDDTNRL